MCREKVICFAMLCMVLGVHGEITNALQCINVRLTQNVLSEFSFRDNSTVSRAFLGFVRGSVEGDFVSFLKPMSDGLRIEEAGCANLLNISSNDVARFSQFVRDAGFTNNLISAYNEFSTNGNVGVNATMVSRCGPMVKTNDMVMVFCHTNSEWRITYWDVDE